MERPPIHKQGKVVVEPNEGGFLVMFPDGSIEWHPSKDAVTQKANAWFKSHVDDGSIGIGSIEWR